MGWTVRRRRDSVRIVDAREVGKSSRIGRIASWNCEYHFYICLLIVSERHREGQRSVVGQRLTRIRTKSRRRQRGRGSPSRNPLLLPLIPLLPNMLNHIRQSALPTLAYSRCPPPALPSGLTIVLPSTPTASRRRSRRRPARRSGVVHRLIVRTGRRRRRLRRQQRCKPSLGG